MLFHGSIQIGHLQRLMERHRWIFSFNAFPVKRSVRCRLLELLPDHWEHEFMNALMARLEIQRQRIAGCVVGGSLQKFGVRERDCFRFGGGRLLCHGRKVAHWLFITPICLFVNVKCRSRGPRRRGRCGISGSAVSNCTYRLSGIVAKSKRLQAL